MTYLAKNNSFLPTGYQVPDKTKQFLKLTPGDNNIRFLSAPLLGYVIFTEDKKPVRKGLDEGDFTAEELEKFKAKKNEDGSYEGSKHFWVALVWSYDHDAPKILEITQISILKPLYALAENDKWGDLRNFDIDITREGTGKLDTEFSVVPEPPTELDDKVKQCIQELEEKELLDLNAIWKGEYPFEIYNW